MRDIGAGPGVDESVLELDRDDDCTRFEHIHTSELYTLKRLILCYVNFSSMKQF